METRTENCKKCGTSFEVTADDLTFYQKVGIPPPAWCHTCRRRARMLFRNERAFYRRPCGLCGKSIIAIYHPDLPNLVYCVKCWWSDAWDASSYGRAFDFSRPFFEQFKELLDVVPALSIMNDDGVSSMNCEYTYDWFYSKNCYMNVAGWHAENVLYSYHIEHNRDIMDSAHMRESELAYECLQSYKLSRSAYCTSCSDCHDCFLSYDLQGCSNCLMCMGLRNKKYCIKNEQYSKEAYEKKVKELHLGSYRSLERLKGEFASFSLRFPRRYAYILRSTNSTGDFILNSKNCKESFMVLKGENLKFMYGSDTAKDTYDCDMTGKSELCVNCMVADEARTNLCTVFCFHSHDVAYSQYCPSAEWCFGSVGMKKGLYAILNKRYSKEEYEKLREKIVEHMKTTGEWGAFFPQWVSPFAYNETAAQELFPLVKSEAEAQGYRWRDPEPRNYEISMAPASVPDTILETPESILREVIGCAHMPAEASAKEGAGSCGHRCTTAFKVVPDELALYRKFNLPVPRLCPNCRHALRMERRNPIRLWNRSCTCGGSTSQAPNAKFQYANTATHFHGAEKCPNEFQTSYSADREEIVYCESCYNAEVS